MLKLNDNKAIVCADLHIDLWSTYLPNETQLLDNELNPLHFTNKEEFRLNQMYMIALRIIFECKKYQTNTVFILGDLIHKPHAKPIVINTLKTFIDLITKNGITIYYILGQHDTWLRTQAINFKVDTWISTLKNPKFKYSNEKQYKFGNEIIELLNFDHDNKCEFKNNTTVGLSHISLTMGQTPKGNNLKLVVAGDIHDNIHGKSSYEYYSVMTPHILYPHQSMNGYIGLLDCSTSKPNYTRIPISGKINYENRILDYKLYNLLESDEYKEELLQKQLQEEKEKQLKLEINNDLQIDITKINANLINEIEEIVKENDCLDILQSLSLTDLPKPIDFNFKLKKFYIKNFRSIAELTIDFKKIRKCTFINGKIGSGKSSILKALEVVLLGDRFIKDHLKKHETDLMLDLTLSYHKKLFRIVKTLKKTEFYITNICKNPIWDNSTKVNLKKKETEDKIFEELPFLNYLHYFICHANSHFFDLVDRTQLFIDIFNLSILDYYKDSVSELSSELKNSLKENNEKLIELNSKLNIYKENKKDIEKLIEKIDSESLIENAQSKLNDFQKLLSEITKLETQCSSNKKLIKSYSELISKNSNKNEYELAKENKKLWESKEKLKNEYTNLSIKYKTLKDTITSDNKLKNSLSSTPKCKCPDCGKEFWIDNIENQLLEYQQRILANTKDLELLEEQRKLGEQAYELVKPTMTLLKCNEIISNYTNSIELTDKQQNIIQENNTLQTKLDELLNKKQQILNLYNFTDNNSYITKLTDNIKLQSQKESLNKQLLAINSNIEITLEKIDKLTNKIDKLTKKYNKCDKFYSMFDMNNLESIPYKLVEKLAKSFNSKTVQFTTTKPLSNGEYRFEINANIKIAKDTWISYDSASDGQKCVLDLAIISIILKNLGSKIGLLILDEFSANIDETTVDSTYDFIQLVDNYVTNMLVTSHSPNFMGYTNRINLDLINGNTIVS